MQTLYRKLMDFCGVDFSALFDEFRSFWLGIASRSRGTQARERSEEQRRAKTTVLVWILSAKQGGK